jgi:hypothetical protein
MLADVDIDEIMVGDLNDPIPNCPFHWQNVCIWLVKLSSRALHAVPENRGLYNIHVHVQYM